MKCKFGSQLAVMICAIKTTERQHRVAARMCKCTQTHMHTYIRIHTHTYPNIFIQLYKLYICALLLCAFCKNRVFQIILSLFFCYLYFTVYVFFFQWNVSFIMLTSKSRASPCHLLSSTYLKFIQ